MTPEELAQLIWRNRQERMKSVGVAPFPLKGKTEIAPSPCILLIDDDIEFRATTRRVLEKQGFIVLEAGEASEISKFIGQYPIALVVLDLHLPWIDGVELCRYMRGTTGVDLDRVPIILISGSDDQALMKQAFQAGCDDYLVKPCDPQLFIRTVRNLLKISQLTT